MILNVSGRCDIVAFYMEWFMNRYKEGYVDVRNPFYKKQISRIDFKNVDLIVFCTKNPIPLIPYLNQIDIPIYLQVTVTGYHKDIEKNVLDKTEIIKAIQTCSKQLGKDKVVLRYDPIFLNEKYTLDYHIKAFDRLCTLLDGYIDEIVISFLDEYKNVKKHKQELHYIKCTEEDYKKIGLNFSQIAHSHQMKVYTCFEEKNLVEYGLDRDVCLSSKKAFELTNKVFKKWKARDCGCVEMVDIGYYNSCPHFCRYCYANYDEEKVKYNYSKHDPDSSLCIGQIQKEDEIKERLK